jgi:hypothetical protein
MADIRLGTVSAVAATGALTFDEKHFRVAADAGDAGGDSWGARCQRAARARSSVYVRASRLRRIAAGDLNYDGYPDLVVAAADANQIAVLLGGAGGRFGPPKTMAAPGSPRGVAIARFSFGYPDIVYTSYTSQTVSVLRGDGKGGFTAGPTLVPGAVAFELRALPEADPEMLQLTDALAVGDFNTNGTPDVISGGTLIMDGATATTIQVADRGRAYEHGPAVAADFNEDGHLDFAHITGHVISSNPYEDAVAIDVWWATVAGNSRSPRRCRCATTEWSWRLPTSIATDTWISSGWRTTSTRGLAGSGCSSDAATGRSPKSIRTWARTTASLPRPT